MKKGRALAGESNSIIMQGLPDFASAGNTDEYKSEDKMDNFNNNNMPNSYERMTKAVEMQDTRRSKEIEALDARVNKVLEMVENFMADSSYIHRAIEKISGEDVDGCEETIAGIVQIVTAREDTNRRIVEMLKEILKAR